MSFCSECGVELSQTESVCPLCGTQINTITRFASHAYPSNREIVPLRNMRAFLTGLILLLIPALCCFIVNIAENGILSWVLYVWGAEVCIFTYVFIPMLFNRPKVRLRVFAGTAVTSGYLFLIGHISGSSDWILPLGLSITLMSGALVFSVLAIIKLKQVSPLFKSAVIIGVVGLFMMAIEAAIDLYLIGIFTLGWALPILLPIACVMETLFYIEFDSKLKDRLNTMVNYVSFFRGTSTEKI